MAKNGKGNGREQAGNGGDSPAKPAGGPPELKSALPAVLGPLARKLPDKRLRKVKATPKTATTSAKMIRRAKRIAEALEYRLQGYTFAAIAKQMKFGSHRTAYTYVMEGIDRIINEPAEQVKKLELARLDTLLAVYFPQAAEGDTISLDRVLKIMDFRARLLGFGKTDGGNQFIQNITMRDERTLVTGPCLRVEFVSPPQPPDGIGRQPR